MVEYRMKMKTIAIIEDDKALNNGIVSAFIATVRVVICEIGAVMILPIFFGLNGIWFAASVAEAGSIIPVIVFVVVLRKRYGYA